MRRPKPMTLIAVAAVLVVPLTFAFAFATPNGSSNGSPANKTHAAGSSLQVLEADAADVEGGLTILSTAMRTSSTADLLFTVSLECALWTEVTSSTVSGFLSPIARAEAKIDIWVLFDGVPVKVDSGDADGKIAFCERVHEQEIVDEDDSTNMTVRQFQETRQANAFTWALEDAGSDVHTIEVRADISSTNTEGSFATGAIGKRTLVVEPVRFASN